MDIGSLSRDSSHGVDRADAVDDACRDAAENGGGSGSCGENDLRIPSDFVSPTGFDDVKLSTYCEDISSSSFFPNRIESGTVCWLTDLEGGSDGSDGMFEAALELCRELPLNSSCKVLL